jgi:serine/threonine protein kinase
VRGESPASTITNSSGHDGPPPPLGCQEVGRCVNSCAAYGRICPLSAAAAGKAARLKMASILAGSPLFGGNPPELRTVEWSDLIMGEKLGEGGFCLVHACALKDAPLDESCAVKSLKPQIAANRKCFVHGAADLATEAFFLGKLDHPNIVKLRGVTAGSVESNVVSSASAESEAGFFIVIDRLVETLEHKIQRWHSQMDDGPHSMFYRMSKEYKDKQRLMLLDRLHVARDIANVMAYLHGLNLTYRDLKPDNCGFTRDGTLKLFDFGLCKEEKPSMRNDDGRYRMTGHTGSRRYMAREGKCEGQILQSVWWLLLSHQRCVKYVAQ